MLVKIFMTLFSSSQVGHAVSSLLGDIICVLERL